jgi:hypothetical protein
MRFTLNTLLCLGCLAVSGLRADSDTEKFFNGKNLDGWQGLEGLWKVEDGAIIGDTGKGINFNTFLCSKNEYSDFEMSFKVRLKEGKGNSGVQIRSRVHDKDKLAVTGPQADIGDGWWGSLYGENFGGIMKKADAEKVNAVLKKDGFNDYGIKCIGKHVTITINGVTTVDDDFKMPEKGIIAFQLHGGLGHMEATFKDIKFKDLSKK